MHSHYDKPDVWANNGETTKESQSSPESRGMKEGTIKPLQRISDIAQALRLPNCFTTLIPS